MIRERVRDSRVSMVSDWYCSVVSLDIMVSRYIPFRLGIISPLI